MFINNKLNNCNIIITTVIIIVFYLVFIIY